MTQEDVVQAMANWVAKWTGRTTYIAESGFTQPATPYCTVKALADRSPSFDIVELTSITSEKVRGLVDIDFEIQAIGGDESAGTGAMSVLGRLARARHASLPRQELEVVGIGPNSADGPRDISMVVGGIIEDRAVMIMTVSCSINQTFVMDTSMEAEINIEGETIISPPDPVPCPAE